MWVFFSNFVDLKKKESKKEKKGSKNDNIFILRGFKYLLNK